MKKVIVLLLLSVSAHALHWHQRQPKKHSHSLLKRLKLDPQWNIGQYWELAAHPDKKKSEEYATTFFEQVKSPSAGFMGRENFLSLLRREQRFNEKGMEAMQQLLLRGGSVSGIHVSGLPIRRIESSRCPSSTCYLH